MTIDSGPNPERLKRDLFQQMLAQVGRIVSTSPNRESKTRGNYTYGWEAYSAEELLAEHPSRKFFLYNEHRPPEILQVDARFGAPVPYAEFSLLDTKTENGIPTWRLYFLKKDGTIKKYHEALLVDEDTGDVLEYEDLAEVDDVPAAEQEELLKELLEIDLLVYLPALT
jgi:hypothetical protein